MQFCISYCRLLWFSPFSFNSQIASSKFSAEANCAEIDWILDFQIFPTFNIIAHQKIYIFSFNWNFAWLWNKIFGERLVTPFSNWDFHFQSILWQISSQHIEWLTICVVCDVTGIRPHLFCIILHYSSPFFSFSWSLLSLSLFLWLFPLLASCSLPSPLICLSFCILFCIFSFSLSMWTNFYSHFHVSRLSIRETRSSSFLHTKEFIRIKFFFSWMHSIFTIFCKIMSIVMS